MKRPTFFEGIGVALILALIGAAAVFSLSRLFFGATPLFVLAAAISLTYMGYLLARCDVKTGRVSVVLAWFIVTTLGLFFVSSLSGFVLLQLGFIWLTRSLYYHNSVLAALMDFGLFALSLMIASWAWFNTESVFITLWSFFLSHALFTLIPSHGNKDSYGVASIAHTHSGQSDRFDVAYRAAQSAVRKLAR